MADILTDAANIAAAAAAAVNPEEDEAAREAARLAERKRILKEFGDRAYNIANRAYNMGSYGTAFPLFQAVLGFSMELGGAMRMAGSSERDVAYNLPELHKAEAKLSKKPTVSAWSDVGHYRYLIGDLARAEIAYLCAKRVAKSKRTGKTDRKEWLPHIEGRLSQIAALRALVKEELPALHAEAVAQMGESEIRPLPPSLKSVSV